MLLTISILPLTDLARTRSRRFLQRRRSVMSEEMKMILDQLKLMSGKIDHMTDDVSELRTDVAELKQNDKKREHELHTIKLLLENEIRPSIRIIAEGHLDLSRNLHEVLKMRDQDEMLRLRVNVLESEVRELKERVDKGST